MISRKDRRVCASIPSTRDDGGKTFDEVKRGYTGAGAGGITIITGGEKKRK